MVIALRERCSAICPTVKRGRVLAGTDLFLLWAGSAIAVDVWYSGGAMAGIGWSSGIVMILLGSFVGSAILAAAGVVGSDYGIPSMVSSRLSYGIRGS
ncbi:MAG TPA: cytosine permease, partial [Candidatus Methanomethylicus sp.]|nr:cytosine permease [Candidatus Methanomethylicus sp.]